MPGRRSLPIAAFTAILCAAATGAQAFDDAKYPKLNAQWTRLGSAQFDPAKGPGLQQEVPFTPEYQAIFEEILRKRAKGGLEGNTTASCLPGGMPRTMIVYETLETIVTPETTYIRGSYMNELRRVFTDRRSWPAKITPSFVGYSIGQWNDAAGERK